MVGFYARADSTKPIRTDLDNELAGKYSTVSIYSSSILKKYVDAKWFTRDEVRSVLEHNSGTRFDKSDYKKMNEMSEGRSNLGQNAKEDSAIQVLTPTESKSTPKQYGDEPPFKLPNVSAIAGVLIRDWVDGKVGFPQESAKVVMQRGNL
jgi:NAD+ diphosphatase